MIQLLSRPNIDIREMVENIAVVKETLGNFSWEVLEQSEIQIKYKSYIDKESELVTKMSQLEDLAIPEDFNYEKLVSLGK